MASFNYMNNTAPFWDFLASLEQQGNHHPFFSQNSFGQNSQNENEHGEDREGRLPPPFDPWGWSHQLFGGPGGLPHRGPPPPPGPHGPPPPGSHGPPLHHDDQASNHEHDGDKDGDKSDNDNDNGNGEGPAGSGSDGEGGRRWEPGHHGRCGGRRGRHGFRGRGGFGPGPHHGGPGHHGPRGPRGFHHGPPPPPEGPHDHDHGPRGYQHSGRHGRRGPWGWNGPFGGPCRGLGFGREADFDPASVLTSLFETFVAEHPSNKTNEATATENEDFLPEADIFDTASSYIIHVSLPGARKEDVGVNWDAEKSELSVAGVIYRPGDEELLKTLAMNERKVGPFERKIRLGTRANPAHVDAEGITAKLEDGVLRIEVRKEDEGFVEIKKVDIE